MNSPITINNPSPLSKTQTEMPITRNVAYLIAAFSIVALFFSVILAGPALTSTPISGCGGGGCESVTKTAWSRWFGIPVSVLAVATHLGLLGSLWFSRNGPAKSRQFAWNVASLLALSAGAAALWFTGLQVFVLHEYCQLCLVAHACGVVIALTTLVAIFSRPSPELDLQLKSSPQLAKANFSRGLIHTAWAGPSALAGVAILFAGQQMGPEVKTYQIKNFEPQHVSTAPVTDDQSIQSPVTDSQSDDSILSAPGDDDSIFDAPSNDDSIFDAPNADPLFESPDETRTQPEGAGTVQPTAVSLSAYFALPSLTSVLFSPGQQATDDPKNEPKNDPKETAQAEETQAPAVAKPKQRLACISGGAMKLDCKQWPVCGDPDAKYVFVEMFDYCCGHCRRTHQTAVAGAKAKMKDELAVMLLPLPLNTSCNSEVTQTLPDFAESCELAKLSISVWLLDATKFSDFHEWMMTGKKAPTYAAALSHAQTLVDKDKLAIALNSKIVTAYINSNAKIYKKAGKGNVPKLMFHHTSIIGEFTSADLLVKIIKEQGPVLER